MKKLLFIIYMISNLISASDHGIYLLAIRNHQGTVEEVSKELAGILTENGFEILSSRDISTPDLVREDSSMHCGFSANLLVFSSPDYVKFLTDYGDKYLVASFLRAAVYTTPEGTNISIADPETINRIVFNDLYENDEAKKYSEVVNKSQQFKEKIVTSIHKLSGGEKVAISQEPIRSNEDLMESSKDMFMMVGAMTFFNDEDQFELIYSENIDQRKNSIEMLISEMKENIKKSVPSQDDIEYRYTSSPDILRWAIICELYSPDSSAFLLGLTRSRTEALSFHIAGASRETEQNLCPGIDHAAAYPVEVLLIEENGQLNVYTSRQMFRMDMYFWDAGMMAFMDHMSMPGILDESLRKSLLADKYED